VASAILRPIPCDDSPTARSAPLARSSPWIVILCLKSATLDQSPSVDHAHRLVLERTEAVLLIPTQDLKQGPPLVCRHLAQFSLAESCPDEPGEFSDPRAPPKKPDDASSSLPRSSPTSGTEDQNSSSVPSYPAFTAQR
jgi:hypothetical protein